MNKNEAISLLKKHLNAEHLLTHSLAVGAIMKETAEYLKEDPEKWEITGILHDLDYEYTSDNPEEHALKTVEILEKNIDESMKKAILAHNEKKNLETPFEIALYAADALSGLITAAILVRPDKDVSNLTSKSLKKKFKDKAFARGAKRENIQKIEMLNITLEQFFEIGIKGLEKIKSELTL